MMPLHDTERRFGGVSIANHWLLAAVVILLLASGLVIDALGDGELRSALIHQHKSVGVLSLLVALWALAWRVLQRTRPGPVPGTPAWEAALRTTMHGALAFATLLLPISGIVMSLFHGHAVSLFGLVTVPAQGEVAWIGAPAHAIHVWGGWALLVLVTGHALAALKHHWLDRDATLTRMTRPAT